MLVFRNWRLDFFEQSENQELCPLELPLKKFFATVCRIRSQIVSMSRKGFEVWFILIFPISFLRNHPPTLLHQGLNQTVAIYWGSSECKLSTYMLGWKFWCWKESKKNYRFSSISKLNPIIIRGNGFDFLQQKFNEQQSTCGRKALEWTVVDCDSCMRNFTEGKPQNWLRVLVSVGTSSQPHEIVAAPLTPMAYQKDSNVPRLAKKKSDIATNLMHNPWEIFFQDRVRHLRMLHAPPQTHFRNHREKQQTHLQDEQQAPRKNQILKHNRPMTPSSCLGARWILAYGTYGWPLYNSYRKR